MSQWTEPLGEQAGLVRSLVGLVFCQVMTEILLTVRIGVISYFVRYEECFRA